jgi:regulator of protease activity HflC (stomatin/prohibitin superfamily)
MYIDSKEVLMGGLIILILAAIVALAGVAWTWLAEEGKGYGFLALLAAFLMMVSVSFTQVDARNVGVQTSFGKFHGTTGPGLQVVPPWVSTEEWPTMLQTSEFRGGGGKEDKDNYFLAAGVKVKIAGEQPALVSVTVEWGVTEKSVAELWKQYRTFDIARTNYIDSEIQTQVAAAFEGYDPFLKLTKPDEDKDRGTYAQFSKVALGNLKPLFEAKGIDLKGVRVTDVDYGQKTDDLLSDLALAVAKTRKAEQDVLTARQEALASGERAKNVAPGCLALIRDLAAADQLKNLPPGVNLCGGAGSDVIINGGPR